MDSAESFIFEVGWIFFGAWGMVIAALTFVAFKADLAKLLPGRDTASNPSAL